MVFVKTVFFFKFKFILIIEYLIQRNLKNEVINFLVLL
jgi:hypothetical protein